MKCICGKPEPSWDIRITCKSKATKHKVYLNVMDHLVILRRDGEITNGALVAERTFWAKEKIWEGEDEPRETDNLSDYCVDFYVIATTEKEPTNPKQFWPRKMQATRIYLSPTDKTWERFDQHASVAHAQIFTRLSARRFCWTHAASKEEVEAATGDEQQLLTIMPEAAILGSDNEYLAPSIWALMNKTEKLALLDCDHQWWCNPRTYQWDQADAAAKMCNDYMEKTPRAPRTAGAGHLARAVLTLRLK